MTELFDSNIHIISERWPDIADVIKQQSIEKLDAHLLTGRNQTISVNGIQLSSRHDRQAEVDTLIGSLPNETKVAYLYGLGLGDVPRELLSNKHLSELNIILMNLAVVKLVISYTDQTDWLTDSRCTLVLPNENTSIRFPFIAFSGELVLADDAGASLRNKLLIQSQTRFAAKDHQAMDPEIQQRFTENRDLIERDEDVSKLFNTLGKRSTIVIGTGPSLADALNKLKHLSLQPQRPLFLAVDTALKPLLKAGIRPDIVVSIDAAIDNSHLDAEASDGIILVYFPRLNKSVLQAWRGQRYIAYSKGKLYDALRQWRYHSSLHSGGSVLHPAVDLAVQMGAKRVYLIGCDLSFPGDRTHTGWEDGELNMHMAAQASHQWVRDNQGQKVITSLSFMGYIDALEEYIRYRPNTRFINTSPHGAQIKGCEFLQGEALWRQFSDEFQRGNEHNPLHGVDHDQR